MRSKLTVSYRPISLTSVCCKIMEHVILVSSWVTYSDTTYLILTNMGLDPIIHVRLNSSCLSKSSTSKMSWVWHEWLEDILKAMDSHHQADLILLDFTKAFDIVPHRCLLVELHYYGIHGLLHEWINAWLTGSNHWRRVIKRC